MKAISALSSDLAVAFLADDFLGEHGGHLSPRSRRKRRRMRSSLAAPIGASALVSSWEISAPVMPAAKLVMVETAATAEAEEAAEDDLRHGRHADGVGAGKVRAMRISAGVSKEGPENHM